MWCLSFFIILVGFQSISAHYGNLQLTLPGVKTKSRNPFLPGWKFDNPLKLVNPLFGGCNTQLKQINNAHTKCTNDVCKVTCLNGYKFPSGDTALMASCTNNVWRFQNSDLAEITDCEPICELPCENNGICIAPGECRCPENFHGPRCEEKKHLCLSRPPIPKYSKVTCNAAVCTVMCAKGFIFPDATTIMNLKCLDGNWVPSRPDLQSIPDCQPTCHPPCENGGTCLSHNVCKCPENFRGPQCQYNVDRCSPKKLKFNGGYNCYGNSNAISCQVYCPKNIQFKYPPATLYTCEFSRGVFEPREVPPCVFEPLYGAIIPPIDVDSIPDQTEQKTKGYRYDVPQQTIDDDSMDVLLAKITRNRKNPKYNNTNLPLADGTYGKYLYTPKKQDLTLGSPASENCFLWSGDHVRTFDGFLYRIPIRCSHVLVKDRSDDTFTIVLKTCPAPDIPDCPLSLEIYFQDTMYTLTNNNGEIELSTPKKKLPIPAQIMGMKVIYLAQLLKIELEMVGVTILWDGKQFLSVEAGSQLWNRTAGLCGTFDMNHLNDLVSQDGTALTSIRSFIDSWKVDDDRDGCLMEVKDDLSGRKECPTDVEEKAVQLCNKILNNKELQQCFTGFDKMFLAESCIEDYCNCPNTEDPSSCVCDAMNVFARECQQKRGLLRKGWRSYDICPMLCENDRVYMPCGPVTDISCGSAMAPVQSDQCNEGCFCPEGTMQHRNSCIPIQRCPCRLRNKEFEAGSKVKKDCNTCVCENGVWNCTDKSCGARCAAVGDPHYTTFDGKRYDFMGKCSYYLMRTNNLSIEAENVACPGSISEEMDFAPSTAIGMPSCTKSVTIVFEANGRKYKIKLDQAHTVHVNDKEIKDLPKVLANGIVKIRQASSTMISVDFDDGLRIWWDGMTRVYIDAPSSYRDKTKGLCGTFNSNMQDDFLTAEGDIETTLATFVDKWRTTESCDFLNESDTVLHPCQANVQNKEKAAEYCAKLTSAVFEDCHWSVDPTTFYDECMFDVCSCKGDVGHCLCPILAAYGAECSRQGIITNWRQHVKECAIECPIGQVYDECGDSCLRSCDDIASKDICTGHCVEGCRCPPGQYLNTNKECVPEEQCQCFYDGLHFNTGYKEVRPGQQFLELCTCVSGRWDCDIANPNDREAYPPASEMKQKCAQKQFAEFARCVPSEPKTCKNMHEYEEKLEDDCKPGCMCAEGYVLDTIARECVAPENCSCHHGGKSYNDGDSFKEECSSCKCKSGKWHCIPEKCAATCTVWGDSHFTSFDKNSFDFQGACDYVLSKGSLPSGDGYSITIQNVLCGTLGVTCSKSVKISLTGQLSDSITLSSNAAQSEHLRRKSSNLGPNGFAVYKSGIMTVVEVTGLGLQIKWDHGTRVYVKLGAQWKGKTSGLCGNYNGDAQDDMINPSQGLETSSLLFGHSWRLQEFCSAPTKQIDACAAHPERKLWAHKKCSVLKTKAFQECHPEVPLDEYFERCIFDTCACDKGGDCECLCTSIAAYASECASKGIPIKWRTPELCPLQCPSNNSGYSPCLPACPLETCENYLEQDFAEKMCRTEVCTEGCAIEPCPEGYIYSNDSYTECVPKVNCRPICMKKNGVLYYEGDITKSDECHTCRCSRKKEICSGAPCSYVEITTTTSTEAPIATEESQCTQGWTDWSNVDTLPKSLDGNIPSRIKINDIEPIPKRYLDILSPFGHSSCSREFMKEIQCRVVGTHETPKETDDNAFCTLDKGLICIGPCNDYEIRVYCECVRTTTETTKYIETTTVQSLCNASEPYQEYADDCYKFRLCAQQPDGSWDYEEKTCGPSMMFNPVTKTCDWKVFVQDVKPLCKSVVPDTTTTSPERVLVTYSTRKPGINKCDPAVPHVEHPTDCTKFLHCSPQSDDIWDYVEKTCGASMMFNPPKMVCDWPANVLKIKPECGTIQPITEIPIDETKPCPDGQKMSDCAVPCGKACHYYGKQLLQKEFCQPYSEPCKPGCVDENWPTSCGENEMWRDKKSCVNVSDCPCMSHSGKFVKPNDIFQESDCEFCQCLDNYYVCSKSACFDQERVDDFTLPPVQDIEDYDFDQHVQKPFIIPTIVTPPKACEADLVPMINGEVKLPAEAFHASSVLGSSFLPEYALLHNRPTEKTSGCWSPLLNDEDQYIEITFQKAIPLYGVIMQGSPLFDQYVTSFKVLYSFDGDTFHYVVDESNEPQIFNGPVDPKTPIQSTFKTPVEAQTVRIYAITWHGGISMRIELLGCGPKKEPDVEIVKNITETEAPKPTEKPEKIIQEENVEPICDDPMGIEEGKIGTKQLSASSIKPNVKGQVPRLAQLLKLSSPNGWQPALDSPNEFIMIDFIELRNITGVKIQGGKHGWITAFKVFYSTNGYIWNPLNSVDGSPKICLGNTNAKTPKEVFFKYPIQARYLKVAPLKWENAIEMKIEPLGCYIPYAEIEEEVMPSTTLPPVMPLIVCPICPGVEAPQTVADGSACKCEPPLFWNGKSCSDRSQCPCVVGHVMYDVGAQYQSDDCQQCVCVLGGVAQCKPQTCPSCPENQRPVKAINCACVCEPCPEFQRLCPSSGDCIPESAWCNGVQDCADDELNCTDQYATTTTPPPPAETMNITKTCPEPECPPGTRMEKKKSRRKLSPMFESSIKALIKKEMPSQQATSKSSRKNALMKVKQQAAKKNNKLKKSKHSIMEVELNDQCFEFTCVPIEPIVVIKNKTQTQCPEPSCPPGYNIEKELAFIDRHSECPKYSCVPRPEKDALCLVNGRSFKTFDGIEYKYDICDHILARDFKNGKWSIKMAKNCSADGIHCQKTVTVTAKEDDLTLALHSDLSVILNGLKFTAWQLENSAQVKSIFEISQPGNSVLVVFPNYGIWLSYDTNGNVKIGVSGKISGTVDGLCGFYNEVQDDDKRLPDGSTAESTVDFGDAWQAEDASNVTCKPQTCPRDIQQKAWEICNSIKDTMFTPCASAFDYDRFISSCIESTCECIKMSANDTEKAKEKCKCTVLENFVKDCLTVNPEADLQNWRPIYNCEIACPEPFVHKDCYKRKCEPSCENWRSESCPVIPNMCFSGCYCPDGMLRKGATCIPVADCMDCECDSFGKSGFITYDKRNFTLEGNCTYLLTRNISPKELRGFSVYITLGSCSTTTSTKTKQFTKTKSKFKLKTPKLGSSSCTTGLRIIHDSNAINLLSSGKRIEITVNDDPVKIPFKENWVKMTSNFEKEILISLTQLKVQITVSPVGMAFTIKLPSVKYGSNLEGLCGDCDGDPNNDLKLNPKSNNTELSENNLEDVIESWQADDPKFGQKEGSVCKPKMEPEDECVPPPRDRDACMALLDREVYGKCHMLVDPTTYINSCQQDMCKSNNDKTMLCPILSAYAKECFRLGVCIDWRKHSTCPFECPSDLIYKSCDCTRTCEDVKLKDAKVINPDFVFPTYDNGTLGACKEVQIETCSCPEGYALNGDKCVPENQCIQCDDGHFAGDVWDVDKCTKCKCGSDGKIVCTKQECSVLEKICEEGFDLLDLSKPEDCCGKFICVPKPTAPPMTPCPKPVVPDCGEDQVKKSKTGSDNCTTYYCECKPLSECPLSMPTESLKPGEVLTNDTQGCCPKYRVECEKSKCPVKPFTCKERFYEVIEKQSEGACCPEYICEPPKNACIVSEDDTKVLKKIGDKWVSEHDPCLKYFCTFNPDMLPVVNEEKETCDKKCDVGFEYVVDEGNCCGKCVQTKCALNETLYSPGDVWYSDDNCTTFKCENNNGVMFIVASEETCPTELHCAVENQYKAGCCMKCKFTAQAKKNCIVSSLEDLDTVGLMSVYEPKHGICRNKEPIVGLTECHGMCSSGTKFNTTKYTQEPICNCCQPEKYNTISVPLKCNDGFVLTKTIDVPASCNCDLCAKNFFHPDKDVELLNLENQTYAKKTLKTKTKTSVKTRY